MLQKFKEKIKIKEKPEYQPDFKGTTLMDLVIKTDGINTNNTGLVIIQSV